MKNVRMNCPVCNFNTFITLKEKYDDRYGEPNLYYLSKCINCNHLSTYPRIRDQDLYKLYSNYYPRKEIDINQIIKNADFSKNIFSNFIRWLNGTNNQGQFLGKKGDKLLDIGCGNGQSLLESKILGLDSYGTETDKNVIKIAKALNLKIYFGQQIENAFPGIYFDIIVLNQVFEHIPDPIKLLSEIKNKLKPNGNVIVVIPNTESIWKKITREKWINWHIPYHLNHFNYQNFKKIVSNCGFKIEKYKTITPNAWTVLQLRSLFIKNKRGKKNKLWVYNKHSKVNKKFSYKFKKIIRFALLFSPYMLITFFNRIIDFMKLGDSLMIILKVKK